MLFAKMDLIFGVITPEEYSEQAVEEAALRYRILRKAYTDHLEALAEKAAQIQILESAIRDRKLFTGLK